MLSKKGDELIIYLLNNIEDELSQEMKDKKKKAFAGDVDSQHQMGIYYYEMGEIHKKNDSAIMSVGIRFLAEAAKRGHDEARTFFKNEGQDWRNYTSYQ